MTQAARTDIVENLYEKRLLEDLPADAARHLARDLAMVRRRIAERQTGSRIEAECGCGCNHCHDDEDEADLVAEALASESCRLDGPARRRFERMFETNFRDVRIHAGPRSRKAARKLGVRAFAVDQDIVIDETRWTADTSSGDAMLAHELTHVVQQRIGVGRMSQAGARNSLERQALASEQMVLNGRWVRHRLSAAPRLLQALNPIVVKCGSICPEVILDPSNGVPCGLADCEFLGFFPTVIATSYCIYRCAINKYGAFIINTRFGPMGPFFTGKGNAN